MNQGDQTALRERFEAAVAESGADAAAIGDSLLSVVDVLSARATVRRALVSTGRTPESRVELANQIFRGKINDQALKVVDAAIQQRWSRPSEFTGALAELGLQAHLASAEANNRLPSVEDEVFRFNQLLRRESSLRSALTDRVAPDASKQQLLSGLLDGKATPETIRLIRYAVVERRQGSVENQLERISELAAARAKRRVAVVYVAAPLSQEHQERLQRALSAQAGTEVQLNVVVDPTVVGGIKVEIGDDVVDGTVLTRLDVARRQLAAGR